MKIFFLILLMFPLVGCQHSSPPKAPSGELRIVCLSPAITQMLIDLGMGDAIVGGSEWDPVLPKGAAVVGGLYQLDYEKLLSIRPTLILIQPEKQVVPARLTELARRFKWQVHAWKIETMDDVLAVLDGAGENVGRLVGRDKAAAKLAAKVREQFAALRAATAALNKPRVLLLVGLNPLTAVGPGTVLDELLAAAGGRNVLVNATVRYPVLDREDVMIRRPEVIVLIRGRTTGTTGAIDPPGGLAGLDIAAVKKHRVMQLTDPVALLPSTSAPRVAVKLAQLLHPSHAAAFEHILNGDERK